MPQESGRDCLEAKFVANTQIVKLNGHCLIDDDHIREIGSELYRAVDATTSKYFLVNMSNVTALSSMMIGQLLNVRNRCEKADLKFRVCDLNPEVAESLKIMNLKELLSVYPTEADAIADASD